MIRRHVDGLVAPTTCCRGAETESSVEAQEVTDNSWLTGDLLWRRFASPPGQRVVRATGKLPILLLSGDDSSGGRFFPGGIIPGLPVTSCGAASLRHPDNELSGPPENHQSFSLSGEDSSGRCFFLRGRLLDRLQLGLGVGGGLVPHLLLVVVLVGLVAGDALEVIDDLQRDGLGRKFVDKALRDPLGHSR